MLMYLVLGDPRDPLTADVHAELAARGHGVELVASPFADPIRFRWRLDTAGSDSAIILGDGSCLLGADIEGVFVGGVGAIDPAGWEPADLAYVRTETHSALLAWLWSLDCVVVNRPTADTWYRPSPPLISWHRRLAEFGLPTLETLVTNSSDATRDFARRHASTAAGGLVAGPLTSEVRYLVSNEDEWDRLSSLQRRTPVPLTEPHGAPRFGCVIGERVVWEPSVDRAAVEHDAALRRFAANAGLALVEIVLAPVAIGMAVIAVETRPNLHHFSETAPLIVHDIVDVLTAATAGTVRPWPVATVA
jgi:hypothetical protein